MLKYIWRLSSIKSISKIDEFMTPITAVYWRLQAVDEEHFAEITGVQDFDITNINGENFTDSSKLTKDDIIGWVQKLLGEDTIESMKLDLFNQIEALK
jgi:hypothetical protein